MRRVHREAGEGKRLRGGRHQARMRRKRRSRSLTDEVLVEDGEAGRLRRQEGQHRRNGEEVLPQSTVIGGGSPFRSASVES